MDELAIIIWITIIVVLLILFLWKFNDCQWNKPSTYCNEIDDICPEELMDFCKLYKGEIYK